MTNRLKIVQLILLVAAAGFATGCSPLKISMKSGSLGFLKQEKQVNVEYSYEGMRVGKFVNEQEYIDKKVAEYNQKEAGRGDQWRQAWLDDRTRRFQPHFEELLNKQFAGTSKDLKFGAYKDAKYTLILKTTFTEPGWNAAIMRSPAFIDVEASFLETQSRVNTLAVVTITKSPGADVWGFDFDAGQRLQESYAKAGKELGKFINKKTK
jgi:hypothetical protein